MTRSAAAAAPWRNVLFFITLRRTDGPVNVPTATPSRVAQLVEQVTVNHRVGGSSPSSGVLQLVATLVILMLDHRSLQTTPDTSGEISRTPALIRPRGGHRSRARALEVREQAIAILRQGRGDFGLLVHIADILRSMAAVEPLARARNDGSFHPVRMPPPKILRRDPGQRTRCVILRRASRELLEHALEPRLALRRSSCRTSCIS